jgi:hypothetical protein
MPEIQKCVYMLESLRISLHRGMLRLEETLGAEDVFETSYVVVSVWVIRTGKVLQYYGRRENPHAVITSSSLAVTRNYNQ